MTIKYSFILFIAVIASLTIGFDVGRLFGRAENKHSDYEVRQKCVDAANSLIIGRCQEIGRRECELKNSVLGISLDFKR